MLRIDRACYPPDSAESYYEWYLDKEYKWKQWKDVITENARDNQQLLANYENIQAHEIVVETIDSVTITYLLDTAIRNEYPLLLIGPTGTGKTIYTMKYLKSLNSKLY